MLISGKRWLTSCLRSPVSLLGRQAQDISLPYLELFLLPSLANTLNCGAVWPPPSPPLPTPHKKVLGSATRLIQLQCFDSMVLASLMPRHLHPAPLRGSGCHLQAGPGNYNAKTHCKRPTASSVGWTEQASLLTSSLPPTDTSMLLAGSVIEVSIIASALLSFLDIVLAQSSLSPEDHLKKYY